MATCELCALQRELERKGEAVSLLGGTEGYTLNKFQGESQRPRFVLQPRRHLTCYDQVGDSRAAALGEALARAISAIEKAEGVKRVYVMSFNETAPGHIHFHLVPRFESDELRGPSLPDTADVPEGFDADAILAHVRDDREPSGDLSGGVGGALAWQDSPLTDRVREVLGGWNDHLSVYSLARRFIGGRPDRTGRTVDVGERYVLMWLFLLVLLATTAMVLPVGGWWGLVLSLLAGYRFIDLVVFVSAMLLTAGVNRVVSFARSLVLFVVNLMELALISIVWLRATGVDRGEAALASFTGQSLDDPSVLQATLEFADKAAVVLIAGVAIALVVGKIGERFTDAAIHGR